jgi:hypothetical protein
VTAVKRFADAYYKDEEDIAKGVTCLKDKESVQKRKKVITSLIKIKLRQS